MKRYIAATAAAMMMLALAGCSEAESSAALSSAKSAAANSAASEEISQGSSESEEEPEVTKTYMEQCSELLEEKPPKELLEEREGVTYPKFEKYQYYSSTAERDTNVNVLLPADYDESREYPVLYILHGYYDNEDWMTRKRVYLSTMLTNLIADGKAKEMIVVCPYIFCDKEMPYCTGMDTDNTLAYDNFINDLTTDLMPFIEEKFSVAKGRENTAITGFSMGARESLYIGFTHPDKFGYIGSVCTAPGVVNGTGWPYNLETEDFCFKSEADKPYLLIISAANGDGVVGSNPENYHNMLTQNGTEHLWHLMNGTGHDASSVTPHLYNFIRMIFLDK